MNGIHPRATEHISEIITLISRLIENGHAYAVPSGDVYYRVSAFPGYGKLSGQNIEDREMGACERLNVETDKENPADFALWKAQKPGEPAWDSPWGKGRPGWHIECSAMSMKYLGETFDIHCGGKDLLFPHHENEIAQSEGPTGKKYVNYWMHNGFINVDNQKMSKSLNNFFTVRDIAKDYDLEAVRLFMLSAHYRSPINFSRDQIESANASLNRLYTARNSLKFQMENGEDRPLDDREKAFVERLKGYEKRFDDAMDDDMNTADALGAIFELVKDANVTIGQGASREAASAAMKSLESICDVLGILSKKEEELPAEIAALVNERAEARKNKDWKASDSLRDELKQRGNITGKTIQVADKGLNCINNILHALKAGDGYIFSKSVKGLGETEKVWVLLDSDYKDVRDHDGNVLYRIKDCIDDFPYDYYDDQGKKHTVKLREKRVATFNPKLAEKQIWQCLFLLRSTGKKDIRYGLWATTSHG